MSFKQARKFAQNLKLTSLRQWKVYCKNKPTDIPYQPHRTYKDEWKGWADFLGKK